MNQIPDELINIIYEFARPTHPCLQSFRELRKIHTDTLHYLEDNEDLNPFNESIAGWKWSIDEYGNQVDECPEIKKILNEHIKHWGCSKLRHKYVIDDEHNCW
tara:strand:+ start:5515 stop:5823 length:309 start_codon:yes stop_codon:yes gene_type:complete